MKIYLLCAAALVGTSFATTYVAVAGIPRRHAPVERIHYCTIEETECRDWTPVNFHLPSAFRWVF